MIARSQFSKQTQEFLTNLKESEPRLNIEHWLVLFEDSVRDNSLRDSANLFGVSESVAIELKSKLIKSH